MCLALEAGKRWTGSGVRFWILDSVNLTLLKYTGLLVLWTFLLNYSFFPRCVSLCYAVMIGSVYADPPPCRTSLPAPQSHCSRPPEPRAERPVLHRRFQFSGCQCPHKAVQSANSRTSSSAPREAPYPLAVPPQSSWPQTPDSSNLLAASGFVSQGLSYEWNHSLCILLGLASVTSGMVHPSFLCVVALFLWLIIHCVDTEHFVYSLISKWTFNHFPLFRY